MNRRELTIVIGTAALLVVLSINLALQDRERAVARSKPPDPRMFHSARRIPPEETGEERILEVVSPGKVFRIPADLIRMGPVPTSGFTLQLVWPEWVPLGSSGRNASVKDGVKIHVRLEPNRGQRTGRDLVNWTLDAGSFLPGLILNEYPGYRVYPMRGYQESKRVGTALYESTRSDGVTPEGEPIVFRCNKGKGKDGGDWTLCRGYYRIFGDLLVIVDFFGEHIKDGTDIYLKSMELIHSLVELQP